MTNINNILHANYCYFIICNRNTRRFDSLERSTDGQLLDNKNALETDLYLALIIKPLTTPNNAAALIYMVGMLCMIAGSKDVGMSSL